MDYEKLRIKKILILFSCGIVILYANIFYIQVIKGKYYFKKANINRIRLIHYPAVRGRIFDRNGKLLAEDKPTLNLVFYRSGLSKIQINQTLNKLKQLIEHLDIEKIKQKIRKNRYRVFEPIVILEDLRDERLLAKISENMAQLPGVGIKVIPRRYYPEDNLAAHVIGYVSKISYKEYGILKEKGYRFNDRIGKAGIEFYCEEYLRGEDGGKQIEVDALGRCIKVLAEKPPKPGADVFLTIDKRIQTVTETVMQDKKGVVIVADVNTGEILAMVSKPDFSPNLFAGNIENNTEKINEIFCDKNFPFINRAIQALYAPGSIFKIITAACALEEKIISETDILECEGVYKVGKHKFKCFAGQRHGRINIVSALAHSCNIFFYQLGLKVGVSNLIRYAKKFGLGKNIDIELPFEKNGFLPTTLWKWERFKRPWYPGETLNLAIGQGYIQTTPLQIVNVISALITGRIIKPKIIKEIVYPEKKLSIKPIDYSYSKKLDISEKTREIIKKGLLGVVEYGTGRACKLSYLKIAGKTGTSQNPKGKDHALFVCYAPADNPKVIILVIVEHGGSGGAVAAPIAKEIIQKCKNILFGDEVKITT
jgi:penicillin-binding protein 2